MSANLISKNTERNIQRHIERQCKEPITIKRILSKTEENFPKSERSSVIRQINQILIIQRDFTRITFSKSNSIDRRCELQSRDADGIQRRTLRHVFTNLGSYSR